MSHPRTLVTVEQCTPEGVSQIVTGMLIGSLERSWLHMMAMVLKMDEILIEKYGAALSDRQWSCLVLPEMDVPFAWAGGYAWWERPAP